MIVTDSCFQFTNNWFEITAKHNWDHLITIIQPHKILEIGSYEGASTCYLIQKMSDSENLEIHCVDTWEGGAEHSSINMGLVEERFDSNISYAKSLVNNYVSLKKYKQFSDVALSQLIAEGKKNYFDFVYVDGSHQAPDVLFDAVAAFRLTRIGGVIAFDDYLWAEHLPAEKVLTRCPKPAIDAFTNLYCNKIEIICMPLSQIYVRKIAE